MKPHRTLQEIQTQQLENIRERVLIAMDITPDELARLWRKTVSKLEEQLDAEKVQYFAHEGSVCDQRVDADGALQQKAAIELNKVVSNFVGLNNRQPSSEPKASVTLDFSGWNVNPPEGAKPVDIKVEAE